MNTRTEKEFRLLLPAWGLALALALLPFHWIAERASSWPYLFFDGFPLKMAALVFGLVFLGVSTFGKELTGRTFHLFLSQPSSRQSLWRQKTNVLSGMIVSVWLLFWIICTSIWGFSIWLGAFSGATAFAIMSTGLWTTLLFRQAMLALCFSLLLPAGLGPMIWPLVESELPLWLAAALLFVLSAYGIASYLFARYLFNNVQILDTEGSGLPFNFPVGVQKAASTSVGQRRWRSLSPTRSLLRKELRLHRLNMTCALILFLSPAVAALFAGETDRKLINGIQGVFVLALALTPLLVSSAAIAEERRLGTLDAQHALPVSRCRQFLFKFGITYGILALLGLAFPILLFLAVDRVTGVSLYPTSPEKIGWHDFRLVSMYVFFSGTLALYASSRARSTPGALLFGAGALVALVMIRVGLQDWSAMRLLSLMSMGMGAIVLIALSFRNYRMHLSTANAWKLNGRLLLGTLLTVVALTLLVHYRTWEYWLPEPSIGPPEPALAEGATIQARPDMRMVALPDGRLWASLVPPNRPTSFPESGAYLESDNWIKVMGQSVGLRADGTLWQVRVSRSDHKPSLKWTQVAPERTWVDVAGGDHHFLAISADGTLWGWGSNSGHALNAEHESPKYIDEPVRIGNDRDWTHVFAAGFHSVGVRKGGNVWRWGGYRKEPERLPIVFSEEDAESAVLLENGKFWTANYEDEIQLGSYWQNALYLYPGSIVVLTDDGSLWFKRRKFLGFKEASWQPLTDSRDWVAITASWNTLYVLAADGTWWTWRDPAGSGNYEQDLLAPTRRLLRTRERW